LIAFSSNKKGVAKSPNLFINFLELVKMSQGLPVSVDVDVGHWVMTYSTGCIVHLMKDQGVFEWLKGYEEECRCYPSVEYRNEHIETPTFVGFVDPKTHLRQGKGIEYYTNGDVLDATFKDNKPFGNVKYTKPNAFTYSGTLIDGKFRYGIMTFGDVAEYRGFFGKNNLPSGEGSLLYIADDSMLRGKWANGLIDVNEPCTFTWANGDMYKGMPGKHLDVASEQRTTPEHLRLIIIQHDNEVSRPFAEDKLKCVPVCGGCAKAIHDECRQFLCSGCLTQHYCSEKCHRAHWKTHKKVCKLQRQQSVQNAINAAFPGCSLYADTSCPYEYDVHVYCTDVGFEKMTFAEKKCKHFLQLVFRFENADFTGNVTCIHIESLSKNKNHSLSGKELVQKVCGIATTLCVETITVEDNTVIWLSDELKKPLPGQILCGISEYYVERKMPLSPLRILCGKPAYYAALGFVSPDQKENDEYNAKRIEETLTVFLRSDNWQGFRDATWSESDIEYLQPYWEQPTYVFFRHVEEVLKSGKIPPEFPFELIRDFIADLVKCELIKFKKLELLTKKMNLSV